MRRASPRRLRTHLGAVVVVLCLAVGAVVAPSVTTPAAAAGTGCGAHLADSEALARCRRLHPGTATPGAASPAPSTGSAAPAGPAYQYRYVLTCDGNTPQAPNAVLCGQATGSCTTQGQYLYWQYRSSDGAAWDLVGSRCMAPGDAAQGQQFPGFTVADLRRMPLPPGDVLLQPGNGYALAQVPLGVVATAGVAVLPTQLAGFGVTVRATPVSYTWDFGDGTTVGPTSDPGAPYPALDVAHAYTAAGPYAVTLTTTYAGEFSVDGGAFTPVDGLAAVTSAPVPVTVLSASGALVQDPLR